MTIKLEITEEIMPIILKDIDLGIYFIENKYPSHVTDLTQTQVLLDNNVFTFATKHPKVFTQKCGWYYGASSTISLNPGAAIAEQFLSNSNAEENIEKFEEAFSGFGMFPKNYTKFMLDLVRNGETDIRMQIGQQFCYLSLLDYYYKQASKSTDTLQKWIELFKQDIPKIAGVYFIGAISIISRTNPRLRFIRQDSTIDSFVQGLFSKRKQETENYSRWLRNRVFDIQFYYSTQFLNIEEHGGYASRTILATRDSFLGEFVARIFCWHGEQSMKKNWLLMPLMNKIDTTDSEISTRINAVMSNAPTAHATPQGKEKSNQKLRNLIDFSLRELPYEGRAYLHQALTEYGVYKLLV